MTGKPDVFRPDGDLRKPGVAIMARRFPRRWVAPPITNESCLNSALILRRSGKRLTALRT